MASTISSACQATRLWIVWWNRSLTKCAYVAPTHRHLSSAVTARPAMAPNPGAASDGSLPASRRPRKDWTFVTSSPTSRVGSAQWLYDSLYCPRGQAENLIKLHKTQLASDRTSCRSPLANQVRLVLHTGAYWLMLKVRDAIPRPQPLATAEFTTLRMRLIKIAARIIETASRVRVAFAAAHPEAALFASLARYLQPAGP